MSTPIDTTAALDTRYITVDGLRIRYASSPHESRPTMVLLSPWPESIYAWWPMWSRLAAEFSLVAIDLPGFGQSEGRADLMSPKAMGAFIPKILAALDLSRPHLVGPDVGTAALLFTAALHGDAVESIQVGGGAAAFPIRAIGLLQQFIEAETTAEFEALDGSDVAAGAVAAIPGYTAPDVVVRDYRTSYAGTRFADSIAYVRRYPSDLAELAGLLPTITTPVGLIAAAHDPFLPLSDPEQLHATLQHSSLTVLDAAHNSWEEHPEQYAAVISAWVQGAFRI